MIFKKKYLQSMKEIRFQAKPKQENPNQNKIPTTCSRVMRLWHNWVYLLNFVDLCFPISEINNNKKVRFDQYDGRRDSKHCNKWFSSSYFMVQFGKLASKANVLFCSKWVWVNQERERERDMFLQRWCWAWIAGLFLCLGELVVGK